MKFPKYLRTPILKNSCERLLLGDLHDIFCALKIFVKKFPPNFAFNIKQI